MSRSCREEERASFLRARPRGVGESQGREWAGLLEGRGDLRGERGEEEEGEVRWRSSREESASVDCPGSPGPSEPSAAPGAAGGRLFLAIDLVMLSCLLHHGSFTGSLRLSRTFMEKTEVRWRRLVEVNKKSRQLRKRTEESWLVEGGKGRELAKKDQLGWRGSEQIELNKMGAPEGREGSKMEMQQQKGNANRRP